MDGIVSGETGYRVTRHRECKSSDLFLLRSALLEIPSYEADDALATMSKEPLLSTLLLHYGK